jgi:hypothetical protein
MEKTYLFNPFDIKRWTEKELEEQVRHTMNQFSSNDDTPYGMAHNIEVIANIMYLYGEMIARLTNKHSTKKLEVDTAEAKAIYTTRKGYKEASSEKIPAMSYFEAMAKEQVKNDRKEQFELQEQLTRFKYAYDSMESKMNAIKKKLDAIKYEESFGG